ncbi:MAG: hypothetical protein U0Z53_20645 [Blastocatellia bacterium]
MTSERELILSQIKSLETQLRVLQACIAALPEDAEPASCTFADLYGTLRGQSQSSSEEIEAVLYQIPDALMPEARG